MSRSPLAAPIPVRRILFLRLDAGPLIAGEFRRGQQLDGTPLYEIGCPGCGATSELPDTHEVKRSGAVTLVWSCQDEGCSYADYLQLVQEIE